MPEIDARVLAENYGFAWSVLNSNPELKSIFDRAVAETWTPDKFVAQVRGTNWYKKTSENERNSQMLRATDPSSYNASVAQVRARVQLMATEYGAQISTATLNKLATQAFDNGWDDNQLRMTLGAYVKFDGGNLQGQAGVWEREWRDFADNMGVKVSDSTYGHWARLAVKGNITPQDVQGQIVKWAVSAMPHFADRFKAGETLAEIADPYRQAMGTILEVNPNAISLQDRTLRGGLMQKDAKGKPVAMTLYEWEDALRKDPRWRKTNNAKEKAAEAVRGLGQMFGQAV